MIALVWPSVVFACGVCDKDDLAAVYDHAAAEKVKANAQHLEYAVIKITGDLTPERAQAITTWLSSHREVDASTIKISVAQRTIGLVISRNLNKHALVRDLGKNFHHLEFESKEVEL